MTKAHYILARHTARQAADHSVILSKFDATGRFWQFAGFCTWDEYMTVQASLADSEGVTWAAKIAA
jgi:hypothetical protein